MWFGCNIQPGSERDWLLNRMHPDAYCRARHRHFSFWPPFFPLPALSNAHRHTQTHAHSLPRCLWLEYISRWPRQVTDGDLTALLTVNWVLIKPKHVWEMLIIHCRLRERQESSLENIVTMHAQCVSLVHNHFPRWDKGVFIHLWLRSREK